MLRIRNVLGRKLRIGRLGLPVWTVVLAIAAVGAVAGQAVGPVLAGSVTGSTGVVLEQAVVLSGTISVNSADDAASTVNDEGTGFTVAVETDVGQSQTVAIGVSNTSAASANAILSLNVPAALDVSLEAASGANEAQLNRNQWLVKVPTGGETLTLTIESADDAATGFYTITGSLVKVSG